MSELSLQTPSGHRSLPAALPWLVLALWAGTSFTLARNGVFVELPEDLPLRMMAAVAVPVILFLAACTLVPAVRDWINTRGRGLVVAAQTWRVIGVVFLVLWAMGDLPAFFLLCPQAWVTSAWGHWPPLSRWPLRGSRGVGRAACAGWLWSA